MSQILTLASEFIERMSNPAYGIAVNEDYAMRLGRLWQAEGFGEVLRREVLSLRDPDCLSPHGWLWLLGWARSNEVPLDEGLLTQLSERQTNVLIQSCIIDAATQSHDWVSKEEEVPIYEFPHQWLSKLMLGCIKMQNAGREPEDHIDTRRAEIVLVSLMQAGSVISLDAARSLLHHKWIGQSELLEYFWTLCNELDEQTRNEWVRRLNLQHFQ